MINILYSSDRREKIGFTRRKKIGKVRSALASFAKVMSSIRCYQMNQCTANILIVNIMIYYYRVSFIIIIWL